MPIFSPTFVFFHIFLLFLSKLLMFSSRTILVPLGNKEADKWIAAKVCFQFLCWFFSDRTIIPGWCAGVRAQYGGWRTTDRFTETLFPFQILFWIDTRWFWVLKGKKKRISDPHALDPQVRWMEGRWGQSLKNYFLEKFFAPKFFWPQTGKPCEYRETCYL